MSAAFAWLAPLPLHASLDDWHGWAYQLAAIAIVGGVWLGLAGVAERRGSERVGLDVGVPVRGDVVGAARGSKPRATRTKPPEGG